MIEIINRTDKSVNQAELKKTAELFLEKYKKKDFLLSLVLVGDREMKVLNKRYRSKNAITDVLSFRQGEKMGNILGEIFLNLEETKRLDKYGEMFLELGLFDLPISRRPRFLRHFLLVHGLFHLIGYNDDSERERIEMMKLGKQFMKKSLAML